MSTLYVVATPIGNLSDLTSRAIEMLSSVPVVAAEDTRVAKKLLSHIEATPQLESLHGHTSPDRLAQIVQLLNEGDMAVVTDAGTPGISDPGSSLVQAAVKAGHDVTPLPGPSAVVTALSITGWSFDRFLFIGFLPRKKNEQLATLQDVAREPGPVVVYESPHRIKTTLKNIDEALPDRQMVICRELTKLFEETFRGTAPEALAHFEEPRGEFVLVIEGAGASNPVEVSDQEIQQTLESMRSEGVGGRTLVDRAIEITGASRKRVYRLSLGK